MRRLLPDQVTLEQPPE